MKVAILMPQVAPGAKPTIVIPAGQSLANKKAVLLASAMRLHQLAAQVERAEAFIEKTGYPFAQRNSVVLRLKLGWKIIGAPRPRPTGLPASVTRYQCRDCLVIFNDDVHQREPVVSFGSG